jgi:hypothetical protein
MGDIGVDIIEGPESLVRRTRSEQEWSSQANPWIGSTG